MSARRYTATANERALTSPAQPARSLPDGSPPNSGTASGEELEHWREWFVPGAEMVRRAEVVYVDDPGH